MVLEEKVKRRAYGAAQIRTLLQFETESVPVHQFQARVGDLVLRQGGRGLHSRDCESQMVPIINLALRVRLSGSVNKMRSHTLQLVSADKRRSTHHSLRKERFADVDIKDAKWHCINSEIF